MSHCSPSHKNNPYTCFSDSALLKLVGAYNREYKDADVVTPIKLPTSASSSRLSPADRKFILDSLRRGLKKSNDLPCDEDYCILNTPIGKSVVSRDSEIRDDTFRPEKPDAWYSDDHTWLTNFDIEAVMRQYEEEHADFAFFGPSPIDFDSKTMMSDRCIEQDICRLSLRELLARGKTKIGIVFNLDPHDKPGSHWTAMMCDIANGGIYYFDSNGVAPPKEVTALMHRLRDQGNRLVLEGKVNAVAMKNKEHHHPLDGRFNDGDTQVFHMRTSAGSGGSRVEKHVLVNEGDICHVCHVKSRGGIVKGTQTRVKEVRDGSIVFENPVPLNGCKDCTLVRRDFEELYNPVRFQFQNTECGMFSMYFLIQYINGRSFFEIVHKKIHDDDVWKNRDVYFRPNVSVESNGESGEKSDGIAGLFTGGKRLSAKRKGGVKKSRTYKRRTKTTKKASKRASKKRRVSK